MVDLASRSGAPDRFSPCPYEGRLGFFLKNSSRSISSMVNLLDNEKDFSSLNNPVTENNGEPLPMEDKNCELAAYAYLEMRMEGIRKNNKGGLKEEAKKYKDAQTVTGEDGDITTTTDSIEMASEIGSFEYSKDVKKIPYLIRRLYTLGELEGIHIISLIIAYEKAKKYITKMPSVGDVHNFPVYKLKVDGDILKVNGECSQVPYNGKYYLWAFPWISGGTTNKKKESDIIRDKEYFEDAKELVYLCHKYGVDLADEDPTVYTKDFIDNLVVTYVTNSRKYITGRHRSLIPSYVWDSIKVEDYNTEIAITEDVKETHKSILHKYKMMFNITQDAEVTATLRNGNIDNEQIESILTSLSYVLGQELVNVNTMITSEGFVCDKYGNVIEVPCKYLTKRNDLATQDTFVINTLGYLVRIPENGKDASRIMTISEALEYIKYYIMTATKLKVPFDKMWKDYITIIDNLPPMTTPYGTWRELNESSV